jgi:hypothetical protein
MYRFCLFLRFCYLIFNFGSVSNSVVLFAMHFISIPFLNELAKIQAHVQQKSLKFFEYEVDYPIYTV